jgi:tetratricopeptide (TPR) repeat protein
MLCILLFAFALRVYNLSAEASFSGDELTIIARSMHSVKEIYGLTNGMPFQALWVKFWALGVGLGYTEFVMYFTSVITGLLAVAVMYRLGKELFDHHVGLLCAFVLTFSAYHVYWSRSLRYYCWMVVLSGLSFLCLYLALAKNRPMAWAGYALFRTLSLYDHLSVLVIWAGEVFFALAVVSYPFLRELWKHRHLRRNVLAGVWQKKKAWLPSGHSWQALFAFRFFRFVLTMTIILLVFSPRGYVWARNAYLGISNLRVPNFGAEQVESIDPVFSGRLYVSWQSPFIILRLFDAWVSPLHTIMMLGFVGGFLFCVLRRQWVQAFLVLAVMSTPFVLLASVGHTKPINGRYVISLLPLYYLMVGRGISGFSHGIVKIARLSGPYRAPVLGGLSAIFMVVYVGLSAPRIALTHWNVLQNWRGVGQFLAQVAQPDQLIVVHAEPSYAKAMRHYLPGFNVLQRGPQSPLDTLFQREKGFWLVSLAKERYEETSQKKVGNLGCVELIFRGAWHPDMDQATDLRPPFSWDLTVAYVSRSLTSPEKALALYEAWIPQAEACHLRHHLTWARAYQRFDQPELAVSEYTLALTEGYVNDQLAAHIFDARGTSWYRLGQTEQAIADWQQAIAHADWDSKLHQRLTEAYLRLGKADAAQALCQAAIAANPREAWPHVWLGNVYRLSRLDEQAISEYREAIEIEPANQAAYWHLGRMYAAAEGAQVVSLYQDAMRRNPSSAWPHLQLGQFYQGVGKVTEAVVEYQRAVELQPEYERQVSGLLRDSRWDLETVLGSVEAYSDQGDLLWWPDRSWVKPYPDEGTVMVGHSTLAVEGQVQPHQLFVHPFSDQEETYVGFQMPDNPFAYLHVGYGLADKVAGLANGVEYIIEVRRQGTGEYEPLFAQTVTQNVWRERTISLAPYWGEDLDFRLVVDARGDYAYDWLQTTVELVPPPHNVWNLSAHLAEAQFISDTLSLEWQGDGFYTPDGGRLLARSELPVGGQSLPAQVHLHPYSSEIASTLVFTLTHHPYRALKTSYGLADQALPHSNGVDYAVSVSVDGGESFIDLVQTTVITNTWRSALVDLPSSQDLVLKLNSSARQDATFDWLQVNLVLLPFDDESRNSTADG